MAKQNKEQETKQSWRCRQQISSCRTYCQGGSTPTNIVGQLCCVRETFSQLFGPIKPAFPSTLLDHLVTKHLPCVHTLEWSHTTYHYRSSRNVHLLKQCCSEAILHIPSVSPGPSVTAGNRHHIFPDPPRISPRCSICVNILCRVQEKTRGWVLLKIPHGSLGSSQWCWWGGHNISAQRYC